MKLLKLKLSVCLQEVRRLNNNSVIITNKQNNVQQKYKVYWSDHGPKRRHGVGTAIKVDEGIRR